ncbi:7676_t:CDS:1, partial [Acaulospora colombiana]
DTDIQNATLDENAMDAEMDDGETNTEARAATLLAPTPVKSQSSGRWKGSSMQQKNKRSKANPKRRGEHEMEGSEDEEQEQRSDGEGVPVVEVNWKVRGPLHVESSSRTTGDHVETEEGLQDHEDENFQLQPAGQLLWMGRQPQEEDEEMEQEEINIDVPPELREVLELSPSKPRRTDEEVLEDLFSGKGDRTKRAEVWTAGDFDEDADSEEWDGDAVGWWEAEL